MVDHWRAIRATTDEAEAAKLKDSKTEATRTKSIIAKAACTSLVKAKSDMNARDKMLPVVQETDDTFSQPVRRYWELKTWSPETMHRPRTHQNHLETSPGTLPPTLSATTESVQPSKRRRPRAWASDLWSNIRGCDHAHQPADSTLDEILASDLTYQNSKPFHQFSHPTSQYLRCILCLREHGEWKIWENQLVGKTGSLRNHLINHHGQAYYQKCREEGLLPGGGEDDDDSDTEFSSEGLIRRIAEWIAFDDQATQVVEKKPFRRILMFCSRSHKRLRSSDIFHRTKLTSAMSELHQSERERMMIEMRRAKGRISITSDLWSNSSLASFMAVTAHYINSEGNLAEHLLAFRRIHGSHTGTNIGRALFSVFEEYHIVSKIGHVTFDNASNNDTMMKELERLFTERGVPFNHKTSRVRCFPHIINLVVQSILKALPNAAASYREYMASQADDLAPYAEEYLAAMELDGGPIDRCRESVIAMRASDQRREGLQEVIRDGNFHSHFGEMTIVPLLRLLRDCPTRWSSTFEMIHRYILLYPAIERFAFLNPGAHIPILTHRQFEVLQDISSILSVTHRAQQIVSAERTPTIALALPAYEALNESLGQAHDVFPELSHAIFAGSEKLNDYVNKTRDIPVYPLAMLINPALKLTWIRHHWPQANQEWALNVIHEELLVRARERHHTSQTTRLSRPGGLTRSERSNRAQAEGYLRLLEVGSRLTRASAAATETQESQMERDADVEPATSENRHSILRAPSSSEIPLDVLLTAEIKEELRRWEAFPMYSVEEMGTIGLVEFWKAHALEFPLLYQIAMDVLPVQASSVSSERAFSSSRLTCTQERNKALAENIEILQIVKHSLHRRRPGSQNNQTLDFVDHVIGQLGVDSESEV